MNTNYPDDDKLIESLKGGNEKVLKEVYHLLQPDFTTFIVKSFSCDSQHAQDIYPEAFSIVYFNICKGKLSTPMRSTLKTYLFSVGKHLFTRRYRDKYSQTVVNLDTRVWETGQEMVEASLMKKEQGQKLKSVLNHLGPPCRELLHLFYFRNFGFEAIAEHLNENEGRLRKRKYDCLKKLHQMIQEFKITF